MKRLFPFTLLLFLLLSCQEKISRQTASTIDVQKAALDSLGERYLQLGRFSGMILIAQEDSLRYANSFGMANYEEAIPFRSHTAFQIGELAQLVYRDLLERTVSNKQVNLDTSLRTYLPEIESDLTLSKLLHADTLISNRQMIQLIERVSARSFDEQLLAYTQESGLQHTGLQPSDSLTAIGYLYQNYRGQGLELHTAAESQEGSSANRAALYASARDVLQILRRQDTKLEIHGYVADDGFSYAVQHRPNSDRSIVILSNRRHPVGEEILQRIEALLEGEAYQLPLERKPVTIDPKTLADFSGHYALNEQIQFEVRDAQDSLYVFLGPTKTRLIPQSSHQFYMEETDAALRFIRDASGSVEEVILLNGFMDSEQIAKRIR
ncbi:DUF3471 domain-containing protein [Croceiramulus getboli]|nr:DUF3471 domain-containing protein [Flavobacteriaceae bacterium YJPT1-3]